MLYKLLLYIKNDSNVFLVDTIFGESFDDLLTIAKDRLKNNLDYTGIILSYNIQDAMIVSI